MLLNGFCISHSTNYIALNCVLQDKYLNRLPSGGCRCLFVDYDKTDWILAARSAPSLPPDRDLAHSDSMAYVVMSSGTTGTPKVSFGEKSSSAGWCRLWIYHVYALLDIGSASRVTCSISTHGYNIPPLQRSCCLFPYPLSTLRVSAVHIVEWFMEFITG